MAGTDKCKFCGATGLTWNLDSVKTKAQGKKVWYLTNADGSLHSRNRTYPTGSCTMTHSQAISDEAPQSASTNVISHDEQVKIFAFMEAQLKKYQDQVPSDVAHALDVLKGTILADAGRRAAERADQELGRVPQMVAEQVKLLVPQEHIITLQDLRTGVTTQHEGRPHKMMPVLIDLLLADKCVMLVGPTGSGKSYAAELAATLLSLTYAETVCGPNTDESTFMGFKSQLDGSYYKGSLRDPYELGHLLCADEIDGGTAGATLCLNNPLASRHAAFPDAVVTRHPDFRFIGTANTYGHGADRVYVGRNQLDAATLTRFAPLEWEYDEEAELDWAGRDMAQYVQRWQRYRHIADDHKLRVIISPRQVINGADCIRKGMDPELIEGIYIWAGIEEANKRVIING